MISKIVYFFDESTGFADQPVFVGLLKIGTVVQGMGVDEFGNKEPLDKFGHIVGFSRNRSADLTLGVKWDWDPELVHNVHPSSVILLA